MVALYLAITFIVNIASFPLFWKIYLGYTRQGPRINRTKILEGIDLCKAYYSMYAIAIIISVVYSLQGYVDSRMNYIHFKIVCRYVYQMSDSKTHRNQMQCILYFRCVCFGFLLKGSIYPAYAQHTVEHTYTCSHVNTLRYILKWSVSRNIFTEVLSI